MRAPRLAPNALRRLAFVNIVLLVAIIVSGAIVRLSRSGLGCADWPNCSEANFVDISDKHSAIEQLNRIFSGLLGIPLFDLLFSVVRRWRENRPLFHGDNRHLSHRLVGAGLDSVSAVLLLWGVHLILAAAAVFALPLGPSGRFTILLAILVSLAVLSAILVRVEARHRHQRSV